MKTNRLWVKWVFCLIPSVIALLIYFLLPHFPSVAEYVFARGIFRVFGFAFQKIVSLIPFSLTEIIVVAAIPLILTLFTLWTIKIIKSRRKILTIEKGVRFTAFCLSLALLVYMVMHGANYNRYSVAELMNLKNGEYTAEDLYNLTEDIAEKARKAREKLPEDQNGCVKFDTSQNEILKNADNVYENVAEEYPFLKTGVIKAKSVMLSHYWSYTGITGVYCPWLSEANVNTDVPKSSIPHTAAHEIAHTMGIAREDECNFVAWLACNQSDDANFNYSGNLSAYIYCINTLYKADKELYKKAILLCSDGMLRDINERSVYWKSFEGEVMESSEKFNDSFIKANGDEKGVFSYNQMVELLLRYYDTNK